MITRPISLALCAALLASCQQPQPEVAPDQVSRAEADSPEVTETPEGQRCYGTKVIPAEYGHVMGQVQVVQAERAADGTIINPPVYRNQPVPKLIKPRSEQRFEIPCPEQMTPEFIATVQRALFARGYYKGRITGTMDSATKAAVLHYQQRNGLDSDILTIDSARALGASAILIPGHNS